MQHDSLKPVYATYRGIELPQSGGVWKLYSQWLLVGELLGTYTHFWGLYPDVHLSTMLLTMPKPEPYIHIATQGVLHGNMQVVSTHVACGHCSTHFITRGMQCIVGRA